MASYSTRALKLTSIFLVSRIIISSLYEFTSRDRKCVVRVTNEFDSGNERKKPSKQKSYVVESTHEWKRKERKQIKINIEFLLIHALIAIGIDEHSNAWQRRSNEKKPKTHVRDENIRDWMSNKFEMKWNRKLNYEKGRRQRRRMFSSVIVEKEFNQPRLRCAVMIKFSITKLLFIRTWTEKEAKWIYLRANLHWSLSRRPFGLMHPFQVTGQLLIFSNHRLTFWFLIHEASSRLQLNESQELNGEFSLPVTKFNEHLSHNKSELHALLISRLSRLANQHNNRVKLSFHAKSKWTIR